MLKQGPSQLDRPSHATLSHIPFPTPFKVPLPEKSPDGLRLSSITCGKDLTPPSLFRDPTGGVGIPGGFVYESPGLASTLLWKMWEDPFRCKGTVMSQMLIVFTAGCLALLMGCVTVLLDSPKQDQGTNPPSSTGSTAMISATEDPPPDGSANSAGAAAVLLAGPTEDPLEPRRDHPIDNPPLDPFIEKALEWLISAQHESGGWGAGSHSAQQILDPHKIQTDPATTAFTAMALLRIGGDPTKGKYKGPLRKACQYLVRVVTQSDIAGPSITTLQGTQPQSKLGRFIDTSMTLQFLSKVLTKLPDTDPLHDSVDQALDKCLSKVQESQQQDGSWEGGSWAGVLQSSVGCSSLEWAAIAGKEIDKVALVRAREHQKGNFNTTTGRASAPDSAGVELYAFAGSQRAAASEAGAAQQIIDLAKIDGVLEEGALCSLENLITAGIEAGKAKVLFDAYSQIDTQFNMLENEQLLSGFGNNGGEEFLSYMLTSEAVVLQGGNAWRVWEEKMITRMSKIQLADGSWTGHHCITSTVFCTAAVIQCLTADRDLELLKVLTDRDVKSNSTQGR